MITFSSCTENNPDQKFKGTLPEKQKGKKKYTCIYPTGKNIKSKKIECARKTKIT